MTFSVIPAAVLLYRYSILNNLDLKCLLRKEKEPLPNLFFVVPDFQTYPLYKEHMFI